MPKAQGFLAVDHRTAAEDIGFERRIAIDYDLFFDECFAKRVGQWIEMQLDFGANRACRLEIVVQVSQMLVDCVQVLLRIAAAKEWESVRGTESLLARRRSS